MAPPCPRNRNARSRLVATLALPIMISMSLLPATLDAGAAAPAPLAADIQVLTEDFEGAFPGALWNITDANPVNGTDAWGLSTARSFGGVASAWSSVQGTQRLVWAPTGTPANDPFADGFENASIGPNWTASDAEPLEGDDYWGISAARYHNGSTSLWSAQVGDNNQTGNPNEVDHVYDNSMDAIIWRAVNLTSVQAINASSATLEFWYFTATELSVDFFDAVYYDGSSWITMLSYSGDSGGWQSATADVPIVATRVGFRFTSDTGGILEGAYVDDVVMHAENDEQNKALRTYDIGQATNMSRALNLTPFSNATLDYRFWLETDSVNDTLQSGYLAGPNWTWVDIHTGTSAGWQLQSVAIPTSATRIGFRFTSDNFGHREGAYVDDVRVWGHVLDLLCGANVSATQGYEANTRFDYNGAGLQGLPPYNFSWNFSDGARVSGLSALAFRTYLSVGTYYANLTVNDGAGQSCTIAAPPILVLHDTTSINVTPPVDTVVEGGSLIFDGADRRNHPADLNWTVTPASCGLLNITTGASVLFTASTDSGGLMCMLTGSFGLVNDTANITVTHDLSAVLVTPPSATIVEGHTMAFAATDVNGHALNFTWSSSCGNVSIRVGPATVFDATGSGGQNCAIAAAFQTRIGTATVTVLRDTSVVSVDPGAAVMLEGRPLDFSAFDNFSHLAAVDWSIAPSACGSLSVANGETVTFNASVDAGGLSCILSAVGFGGGRADVPINVQHDRSVITLQAGASAVVEGGSVEFALLDSFSHLFNASWSSTPSSCGSFSVVTAGNVTFTTAGSAGGINCTVTAGVGAAAWRVNLTVLLGPPSAVVIDHAAPEVDEGGTLSISAFVRNAGGHTLAGLEVNWTSACASIGVTPAAITDVTFPQTAGGTTCEVKASFGSLSAAVNISVRHQGPYTLSLDTTSVTLDGGGTKEFKATVHDAFGHGITTATVAWTASCGQLSATTGSTVTFTAPSDLGGGQCTVSAATLDGGTPSTGSATVTTNGSILLPLMIIVPIAVGAVIFLLWWKKRPPKAAKVAGAASPVEEPKPTFEVDIR